MPEVLSSHADGCPAGVRSGDAPESKHCRPDICRGQIIPLLLEMCDLLTGRNDLSGALDAVLRYMREDMGVVRAMINLRDQETSCTFIHRSIGLTDDEESRGVYFPGEGITGRVDSLAQPVIVPRIGDEPAFLNRTGSFTREADLDQAFMCAPIQRGRKVLGSISAIRPYDGPGSMRKRLGVLKVIASMLAQALELLKLENVDQIRWERRHEELMDALRARFKPRHIIGGSERMMEVFALTHKVARTKATVLLLGESGVGKEMIASTIHYEGLDPSGPLIRVNCAALPETLLESELFGHEKGAFTGADQLHRGRFEEADGGTIFLDEVGELPSGAQAKLLRVLQTRSFERVGGNRPVTVNLRIIAATNRSLLEMVRSGSFREDLYFRLNVFPIMIPPLRERREDIIALAEHFVAKFAAETEKTVTSITTPALNLLMAYAWPGNVRELENVIERAVILTEDDAVHSYNLPAELQPAQASGRPTAEALDAKLADIEREMLTEALTRSHGNSRKAAQALGLTYRSMCIRMQRHGLRYSDFRSGGSRTADDLSA